MSTSAKIHKIKSQWIFPSSSSAHVCFLPDIFSYFSPASAALCDSEGECPGVQGALQDGEGVPQGRV